MRKREWLNELLRVWQVYTAPMPFRAQARMVQAGIPFPRQCRMLMSSFPTEAFGVRVSACRALDYGECALFRKRNLFMYCLPLLLYAFLCSVTLARGRVCVYILCLFSDIYVRRPKAAGVLSGSFMRLSRAACAKCSGVNILLRGIWRQGRRAPFVRRNIPCVNLNLRHMYAQNI